jgi:outer membrane protein OmpA-like peptidoglycan-associated protein
MPNTTSLLMSAAALSAVLATPAHAEPAGVKIGVLSCHVESGWGFVFGSSKEMQCAFRSNRGEPEYYSGTLSKLGVDIGYTGDGELVWDVIAPTADTRMGALEGDYGGATASVTVLAGVGAHVLVGGLDRSIAGLGAISLRAEAATSQKALSFDVFFDSDSIYLSPEGGAQIAHAVNAAEDMGLKSVRIIGDAGTVEPDPYDNKISDQRALSVRNELLRDGLRGATISIGGRAYRDPRATTAPELRERESGRVTIELTKPLLSDATYR